MTIFLEAWVLTHSAVATYPVLGWVAFSGIVATTLRFCCAASSSNISRIWNQIPRPCEKYCVDLLGRNFKTNLVVWVLLTFRLVRFLCCLFLPPPQPLSRWVVSQLSTALRALWYVKHTERYAWMCVCSRAVVGPTQQVMISPMACMTNDYINCR